MVKEFFLFSSLSQFAIFDVSDRDWYAIFSIESIKALLKVFSYLASTYIMWKLVIKGADWVIDLLGLKGGQDNVMIESLSTRLEQNVFRA
ncbi:hypothetical protein [Campylobacter pinnipediorum]|uniref:Uncharacterized protein n=1 Tax=Campylobacter pinnipediorum subsp. pinnipediorum TaxID=1660067 RepID=A0AAX0LA44_9BACT|nr:hypothetical protein [Campylobacter pinnipediorum]AQW81200.1 hypothetical protein CPIN17260_0900 [Campylobacter pinnipediorum subsp. pinnipediorum]OPA77987.1 hypothetical protein BFG04_03460 [Campylobacter pinnipediorum subsp. pinnipediorum]